MRDYGSDQPAMKRILMIEDDKGIVELVRYALEKEAFEVAAALDGLSGLARVKQQTPDLLMLDLMLPKLSGLEICRQIRSDRKLRRLPILILSVRGHEADRVTALELGADDYVTKPFSPRELVARVKALLRRSELLSEDEKPIKVGPLAVDPVAHTVTRAGKPLSLSALEFRLLHFLASHPNRVFSRDQLLDAVWGIAAQPRSVDACIRRLRTRIENDPARPAYLQTIRGAGYKFVIPRR